MCTRCGSSADPEDTVRRVQELIDRNRFAIIGVAGSRRSAEFSYTVGLTAHGLPELIVTAMSQDRATALLAGWADYVLDRSVVLPGEVLGSDPWLYWAVEVEQPQDHLLAAGRLYGDRVRALQLAWCDDAGRWPWEPGHRARRAGQPVLGTPAPYYCPDHSPRLDVPPHL